MAVILAKANETPDLAFEREVHREHKVVERRINRLEQWRRIATRDEMRAANFRAVVHLARIVC